MHDFENLYELSREADYDLEEIFDYSIQKFGMEQTEVYLTSLGEMIELIAKEPYIGKHRAEIKNGLYSILHGKHLIFYRILPDKIRIIRILHGSRDLPEKFK